MWRGCSIVFLLLLYSVAAWPMNGFIDELAVLADPSGRESIESISRAERMDEFKPAPQGVSAGYTRTVHWLRLTLDAPKTGHLLLEIQPPYLDDLQLYLPDGAGGFVMRQTGDRHPYANRDVPARGFVFRIDFPDAAAQTLYLRVATTSTSLVLPRAWLPEDFPAAQSGEILLLGLYYGLMLAMLLFNLWHGHWRSNADHRAFLVYAVCVLLFMLAFNGFVAQYLFPEHPEVGHHWLSTMVIVTVGAAAHFHRCVLAIDRSTPILNAYFLGMIGISVLCLFAYLAGYFTEAARILTLAALLFPVFGLARTAVLWRRGLAGSLFLSLAYAIGLVSYLVAVLSLQGLLHGAFWQLHSFQAGALLALMAFNLGLFERLRHLQHQRDAALEDARQARSERDAENLARERQGALLAMLTHELKTPLAVIRLALDQLAGSSAVRRHAQVAIADIVSIIDRCCFADRLDQAEIRIQAEPCRIPELLSECRTEHPEDGRILLTLGDPLPGLVTDRTLLRTILANLFDNALKYGAPDRPIEVRVHARRHADGRDGLEIVFANTPDKAGRPDPERIYARYYRAPAAHATTGSGLGLYLVYTLARLLGGEIRYHPPDASNQLRFVLWLPLNPP